MDPAPRGLTAPAGGAPRDGGGTDPTTTRGLPAPADAARVAMDARDDRAADRLQVLQVHRDRDRAVLAEQVAYYRARAPEYDDWFFRRGEYDHGAAWNRRWRREIDIARAALDAAQPAGRVLELACGTGLWTERLAPHAAALTCVDASPEVIALNRARVRRLDVEYICADLFAWRPPARYDFVCFGFWLSHVPAGAFIPFWSLVARCLAPGGRVWFVDNRQESGLRDGGRVPRPAGGPAPGLVGAGVAGPGGAVTAQPGGAGAARQGGLAAARRERDRRGAAAPDRSRRRLRDGREFEVVKICYRPDDLEAQLRALGWQAVVRATPTFFLHGLAARADADGV